MIGIGGYAGRGLFILGHCAALAWERLPEDYHSYRHRIDVIRDGAVYGADYRHVMDRVTKSTKGPGRRPPNRTLPGCRLGSWKVRWLPAYEKNPLLPWSR